MMYDDEPRTQIGLIRDLAEMLRDRQWSGQYNTSCHCHPEYSSCCPECETPEYEPRKMRKNGTWTTLKGGEHTQDCRLQALLKEADELISAADASEEEEQTSPGKTSWDHVLEASPVG